MGLRERLLVQVAEGVRVSAKLTRASSVPSWYAEFIRDRRRLDAGLNFGNAGFTLDNVPDAQLGDSTVESPADRARRIVRQQRVAADRRAAEREEADSPGAMDEDDWGHSMDAPSIEGPQQRVTYQQSERVAIEDRTLVRDGLPFPEYIRPYLAKRRAAAAPATKGDEQDWRFDE